MSKQELERLLAEAIHTGEMRKQEVCRKALRGNVFAIAECEQFKEKQSHALSPGDTMGYRWEFTVLDLTELSMIEAAAETIDTADVRVEATLFVTGDHTPERLTAIAALQGAILDHREEIERTLK